MGKARGNITLHALSNFRPSKADAHSLPHDFISLLKPSKIDIDQLLEPVAKHNSVPWAAA